MFKENLQQQLLFQSAIDLLKERNAYEKRRTSVLLHEQIIFHEKHATIRHDTYNEITREKEHPQPSTLNPKS